MQNVNVVAQKNTNKHGLKLSVITLTSLI